MSRIAIRKGLLASLLARAVIALGPLMLVPILLECLGQRDYGIWLIIVTVTGYFGMVNLGIAQTVSVELAKGFATADPRYLSKVLSTGWFLYYAIVIFVAAASLALLTVTIVESEILRAPYHLVFSISLACFIFGLPFQLFSVALRARQRVHEEQLINAVGALGKYIAMAWLLLSGGKLVPLAIVYGVAGFIPGIASFLRLRQIASELKIKVNLFDKRIARSLIVPSAGYWTLTFSGILLFGLDTVIIGLFLGVESVPQYAISMQLIYGIQSIIGLASSVSMPTISAQFAQKNVSNLRVLYRMLLDISLISATFVAVMFWVTGPALIPLWAGAEMFPGTLTFALMLAFFIMQASVYPSDALLQGAGQHLQYSLLCLVEGGINLGLSIWWVQLWGLPGVIAATVCARLTTTGWFLHYKALHLLGERVSGLGSTILQTVLVPLATVALALGYWHWQPSSQPDLVWQALTCFSIFIATICLTKRKRIAEMFRMLTS